MATTAAVDPRIALARIDELVTGVRDDEGAPLSDAQNAALDALEATLRGVCIASIAERDRLSHPTPAPRIACDLLAQAKQAEVTIDAHLRPHVEVVADRVKLTWVIASLLGNALRYSPRHAQIFLLLSASRGQAELRVVDQGPGIARSVQERLFDGGGGRGLTLVLIGEIIEEHGGTIAVRSDLGGGTTFVLTMPAQAGPLDPERKESDWTLTPEVDLP